jgi:CheY-like chemotaxis protein
MPQRKVLVVDDEEDILEIIADRLAFYGFEVRTARNGVECLEVIEREVPDLVLLDIRMPGMDGMAVLARLREEYPMLPVVMISASSERHIARASLSQGAVDYILKPFEPNELKEKVLRAIKKG